MRAAIRAFPGVEHRLERVRALHGVSFYNDSIATTPTGTLAALTAIQQPIWLIAGGYDKGLPFQALGRPSCNASKGVFDRDDRAADRPGHRPGPSSGDGPAGHTPVW